jgi:single-stranded DNA-binding protein
MRISVKGRIGKDPREIREGVVNFSLARTESYKKGDEWIQKPTIWFNVFVTNNECVRCIQELNIRKGARVIVEGEFDVLEGSEKYPQPNYRIQVMFSGDRFIFLGSK